MMNLFKNVRKGISKAFKGLKMLLKKLLLKNPLKL